MVFEQELVVLVSGLRRKDTQQDTQGKGELRRQAWRNDLLYFPHGQFQESQTSSTWHPAPPDWAHTHTRTHTTIFHYPWYTITGGPHQ